MIVDVSLFVVVLCFVLLCIFLFICFNWSQCFGVVFFPRGNLLEKITQKNVLDTLTAYNNHQTPTKQTTTEQQLNKTTTYRDPWIGGGGARKMIFSGQTIITQSLY